MTPPKPKPELVVAEVRAGHFGGGVRGVSGHAESSSSASDAESGCLLQAGPRHPLLTEVSDRTQGPHPPPT